MKVLVLDDNKIYAGMTRKLLQSLGMEAEQCTTWKQAEKLLKGKKFDVIMLDYYLGSDGTALDLIPKIREIGDICIITFSGVSKEEMIRDSMKAGSDEFLDKDIWQDRERLGRLITSSVNAHSGYQRLMAG